MTRESKLALVISITLVLLVGVLISDHMSGATGAEFETPPQNEPTLNRAVATNSDAGMDGIDRIAGRRDDALVAVSQAQPGLLDNALDNAIDRLRTSEPPVLIGGDLFERLDERDVTLPPRDERAIDRPVKPINEPIVISQSSPSDRADEMRARWRTHTVAEGDSLYAIARKTLGDGARWPEIQKLNEAALRGGESIKVGMVLRIERLADAPARAEPVRRAPVTGPAVTKPAQTGAPREHVVEPGDILGNIAFKMLGSSKRMDEIVELNGLKDPDDIRVGQTLKIPAR